ncbi:MAG: SDR family NAD(P)-dependent oxidoreductase [Rhizomicrobium sp.]
MERRRRLEGKAAIVTGGAGGIGAATAALFCLEGARVLIADINGAAAEVLAKRLGTEGYGALAYRLDLGDPASIAQMVDVAMASFGRLDILDNNAAAANLASTVDGAVETMDPDVWDQTMAINLRGPMLAAKAAIPRMRQSGGGAIVNILSNSAFHGDMAPTAYATSKGGLATLTRYIATQHGREGIRCNAVSPGLIPIAEKSTAEREAFRVQMRDHELATRSGLPDDIAQAVAFLSSDDAAFVNGQILHVDGGATVHSMQFADGLRARRDAPKA